MRDVDTVHYIAFVDTVHYDLCDVRHTQASNRVTRRYLDERGVTAPTAG
jgi:hypothetical protein